VLPQRYPERDYMVASLTKVSIEKASAGQDRKETPDGSVPGLYLVVQPSGVKSFALRYRYGGKSKKLTLGRYPTLSLADARQKARQAKEQLSYGNNPARSTDNPEMFEAAFQSFIDRHVSQNKSGSETIRIFHHDLLPAFGSRRISDISKRDINALMDRIVDRGSPVMANRTLSAMRKFFVWAVSRDLAQHNPCEGLKPPVREKSRERILTDEEISWFWKASNDMGYPYGTYFQFLLLSAQRRAEVSDMTFDELEGDVWKIPGERSKNGKSHSVPLSEGLQSLIAGIPHAEGYLFTSSGKKPVGNLGRAAGRLQVRMQAYANEDGKGDIQHWRLHDLRRTAASGMARCGVFQEVIERVQNRSSGAFSGVAGIYNRYEYEKEKSCALAKWSELLDLLKR